MSKSNIKIDFTEVSSRLEDMQEEIEILLLQLELIAEI